MFPQIQLSLIGLTFLLSNSIRPGSAVQVFAGTSQLKGVNDQCGDVQEFRCMNDVCDPSAGSANGGRCRNGDASWKTCDAGTNCGAPTAGHCLENRISAPGKHAMPDKSVGTPKHFSCVSVQQFDKPVLLWQNSDCTGSSCYIPSEGQFTTKWPRAAQGNCVEIDPITPINTTACPIAGQNSAIPPNGGVDGDAQEVVGGDYGLPTFWETTYECNALPDNTVPAVIPTLDHMPEDLGDEQRYQSMISDNDGVSVNDIGKRGKLAKRANPVTQSLRDAFNYRDTFVRSGLAYLVISAGGHLRSYVTSIVRSGVSVDHIVELDMIVQFFTSGGIQGHGLTQNQWDLLSRFILSRGIQAIGGNFCPFYRQFAAYVGGLGNLRGVDQRVNQLKAVLLSHFMNAAIGQNFAPNAQPAPNWRNTWTRNEAQATLEYFLYVGQQALDAAYDMGGFLDRLPGMNTGGAVGAAFEDFTRNLWQQSVQMLEDATDQDYGFFRGEV